MSTLAPPDTLTGPEKLYKPPPGTAPKSTVGAVLARMVREGRVVVNQQRPRLQANRLLYRGEQYLRVTGSSVTVLRAPIRANGRQRATVNRLRSFTDGLAATLTHETPPSEVLAARTDQDAEAGARLAQKIVTGQWDNPNGWNIAKWRRDLVRQALIDGIAFAWVNYDKTVGDPTTIAISLDPNEPGVVTDPGEIQALREQDPGARAVWRQVTGHPGDVRFEVVKLPELAIDPLFTTDWRLTRWVVRTRVMDVGWVEDQAGKTIKQLKDLSKRALTDPGAMSVGGVANPSYVDDDPTGPGRLMSPDEVMVHEAFLRVGRAWPRGAHLMWIDEAPGASFINEPWVDRFGRPLDLPCWPFVPRPDGNHMLRARSLVEDLAQLQVRLNRRASQIDEHSDLIARPPLLMVGGSLQSDAIYNEERLVRVTPGVDPPRFMDVPQSTGALYTDQQWIVDQMAEIANQNDVSRGQPPGQGAEAAVTLNLLAQMNEQQMAGIAAEEQTVTQWAVSRALRLVGEHFTLPRLMDLQGVEGEDAFTAFTGEMLRGAHRWVITGPTLPRMRAAVIQTLLQVAQTSGGRFDITPYIAQILTGNPEEIEGALRSNAQRMRRKIRDILALGRHPDRDEIWGRFTEARDAYMGALAKGLDPNQLAAQGIQPARLSTILPPPPSGGKGLLPVVEFMDDPAPQLAVLDEWARGDAWDHYHPLVRQAAREHNDDLLRKLAGQLSAMQAQTPGPPTPGPPPGPAPAPGLATSSGPGQPGATEGGNGNNGGGPSLPVGPPRDRVGEAMAHT